MHTSLSTLFTWLLSSATLLTNFKSIMLENLLFTVKVGGILIFLLLEPEDPSALVGLFALRLDAVETTVTSSEIWSVTSIGSTPDNKKNQ